MIRIQVLIGADGHNSSRINIIVGKVIMSLYVIKIHGLENAIKLKQIFKIPIQIRIIGDSFTVTFEMPMIDGIKIE